MTHRFFADLPNGEVVELKRIDNRNQSSKHNDTWGWNGTGWVKITRVIEYKSNPSKHQCDARCLNAKGFNCECACGGKSHGKGRFVCE